jgi:hypothetical protein
MPPQAEKKSDVYDRLVRAFQKLGRPDFQEAALLADTTVARAKTAWNDGFGKVGEAPLPAIRDMFLKEQVRARATRAKLHKRIMDRAKHAAEDARDDTALSAALEGLVVRKAMMAADELLEQVHTLVTAGRSLVDSIASDVQAMVHDKEVSTQMKMSYATNIVKLFKDAADSVDKIQKMEGRFMGRPDIRISIDESSDIEDDLREIMNGYEVLNMHKRIGNSSDVIDVEAEIKK